MTTLRDLNRRTGRTTRAIQKAPKGAIFISAHRAALDHDRHLARELGRTDLRHETLDFLRGDRWRGIRTPIVADHFAYECMTAREFAILREIDWKARLTAESAAACG